MPQIDSFALSRWLQLWPVGLCWVLMMLANAVGTYVLQTSFWSMNVLTVVISFYFGQFALAAIIGGLIGRTWISGWLFSVVLVTAATVTCWFVAEPLMGLSESAMRLGMCSFWPLLMLGVCTPMMAMRGLFGWSLTLSDVTAIPKQPSRVEDLFLLSVIVASCITLARWMEEFVPGFRTGQEFFVVGLFSAYSLLFVVPATAITFRARNWSRRWLGWLAIIAVVFLACMAMNSVTSGTNFWNSLEYVLIGVPTAAATMMLGGWALLASGVKLTHFAKSSLAEPLAIPSELADEKDDVQHEVRRARRQARLLSGLVALVAVMSVVGLSFSNYRQLAFLKQIQSYDELFPNQVDELTIRGDKVVGTKLAATISDSDLDRYRNTKNDIERLSLAGTQITDAAIEKLVYFPHLKHLDLSNTAITNAGLQKLNVCDYLSTLSVANTNVDFEQTLGIARALVVKELDVSGLGITDDQLHSKLEIGNLSLKLSHNSLTDVGLAKLLQNSGRLQKLDVSDTRIDGSGLLSTNCATILNLDGTKVTDANLMAFLKLGFCSELSIRRTGITAAVLPTLAPLSISLTLGECQISEQDLANLSSAAFTHLGLNDEQFTGACFSAGNISVNSLDLSYSGVTDQTLRCLAGLGYLSHLNLSHTAITDAGLPLLQCAEVDLRHTQVTATGIIKVPTSIGRILIDHNQFTPEELVGLRNSNIAIDGESLYGR